MSKSSIFDVAAKGYKVFPLKPTGGSWFNDPKSRATTEPPMTWGEAERFAIVATSENILCIDMDVDPAKGKDGVTAFQERWGGLPDAPTKPSNGGLGRHALYRITDEQRARIYEHTNGYLPGVDAPWNIRCRADMDYSVLPRPEELPLAPEALIADLEAWKNERSKPKRPLEPGERHPAVTAAMRTPIPQGEQRSTLLAYVGHMSGTGVDPDTARDAFAAAMARCENIEDERAAWKIFEDSYTDGVYEQAVARKEHDAWWDRIIASVQEDEAARRGVPLAQVQAEASGQRSLAPVAAPALADPDKPLFADVALLLSGGMPEAPKPAILANGDRFVFYEGEYNTIFGEGGIGKTWIAEAAVVESLHAGRPTVMIDLDQNGLAGTVNHLLGLGATPAELSKPELFFYCEPTDRLELGMVLQRILELDEPLVIMDSVTEVLGLFGKESNSADDFTMVHQHVVKPIIAQGGTVISIDHTSREGSDPTGTVAKKNKVGGVAIQAKVIKELQEGYGGKLALVVSKDRWSGLGAPRGKAAGIFELHADLSYKMWPATPEEPKEEGKELEGAAEVRIRNFLLEQSPQKASALEIGAAIRMRGQDAKTAKDTARSTLSRLFREGKQGQIKKAPKNDSANTLLYWIDTED